MKVNWPPGVAAVLVVDVVPTPFVVAQEPKVVKPEPVVPEIFALKGEFVRMAYTNEGFVTLGYRLANDSQGEEHMLLGIGVTLRKSKPNQTLTRDSFSLGCQTAVQYR
jgi:hypothetical protein